MSKPQTPEDIHWEHLLRTMIDIIGVERFVEVLDYVMEQIQADRQKLRNFVVETFHTEH